MPADEILAPVLYPAWVTIIAVVALVLVIVGWIILFRRTRVPRGTRTAELSPSPVRADGNQDPWHRARATTMATIDDIGTRFAAGEISERDVHQELAAAVRVFAAARTAVPAESMTLTQLQQQAPTAPAAAVIADLYGPEFSIEHQMPVDIALERTREVVARW